MFEQRILIALSAVTVGCSMEVERAHVSSASYATETETECVTLDFDTTAGGDPIERGDVLHDVYADWGVTVRAFRGDDPSEQGLAVAFDSAHPTGGDWDLAFEDQGNLLISQECFDDGDVIAGYVDVPDDDAHGAVFEISFPAPVCVSALTLLDIDVGEVPTDVTLFGDGGAQVGAVSIDPLGNNTRDVVDLGDDLCGVRRIVVSIPSSGAVDDIVVCPQDVVEEPPLPDPDPENPDDDDTENPDDDDTEDPDDDDTEDPGDDDTETPPSEEPATDSTVDTDDTETPPEDDDTETPPSEDPAANSNVPDDTEPPPGGGDTEPVPSSELAGSAQHLVEGLAW